MIATHNNSQYDCVDCEARGAMTPGGAGFGKDRPRMFSLNALRAISVAAAFTLAGCFSGGSEREGTGDIDTKQKFADDRAAILAMAGDFDVTFDFIETVPFVEGYELKERKLSKANEIVRVIEDEGDYISLQHILVVGGEEKFPIKHWRQDWRFEPDSVLENIGGNAWENRKISSAESNGKWSQTVYQVDDSPRYGALAAWSYENGAAEWKPAKTWRPLPRRDATTRDDYHAIDGVNRHAITPFGWVHEQDNSKLMLDGEPQALVREIVVNTYRRTDGFDTTVGDEYWKATEDFWGGVRDVWRDIENDNEEFKLTVIGEPDAVYMPLLALSSEVSAGDKTTSDALAEARTTIASFVTGDIGPLSERIGVSSEQKAAALVTND
ncbi:MAG: DUF6607 family protein [Pseudomonadota bacterium]